MQFPQWVLASAATKVAENPLAAGLVGIGLANPSTRMWTLRMVGATARHSLTFTGNMIRSTATITWSESSALRLGASRVLTYSAAIAAGYAIGATVGTSIAYAGWGEEGASDALDLYSGNVSWDQYWSTLSNVWA